MALRQGQTELLGTFLDPDAYPAAIGIHGPCSTGKTYTLAKALVDEKAAWVKVDQCLTPRIVLQKALGQFAKILDVKFDGSCETTQIFYQVLDKMCSEQNFTDRLVLVLDRVDSLEESSLLFSTFSKFVSQSKTQNLMVVFVYQSNEPRPLLNCMIPHIYFPRYNQDEAIKILQMTIPAEIPVEQCGVYREFVRVCASTFVPYTDTDITRLQRLCTSLWPRFIEGEVSNNFASQFKKKRHLFNSEIIQELPHASLTEISVPGKYMLCAAFLASHNAERYDFRFFSRAKDIRAKRRKTAPRKEAAIPEMAKPPKVFELERLFAIYHALLPDNQTFVATTRTSMYLADLSSQNFVTKYLPNYKFDDTLESRTRWCANVSFQFVRQVADSIGLEIEHYMVSAFD